MYTITTNMPVDEAVMHAKAWVNRSAGWVLATENEKSLSYTRTKKPNIIILILLLFVWVLPGVLYLIFSWGKDSRNLFFKSVGKGKTQITLEAGSKTEQDAPYMVQYFSQFDSDLVIPPIPKKNDPTSTSFQKSTANFLLLGFFVFIVIVCIILAATR